MVVSQDTARNLAEVFFTYVKEEDVPKMLADLERIRGNDSYRGTIALLRQVLSDNGLKIERIKPDVGGQRVHFTPSPRVWSYLTWLSRNTMLGKTEQEVAEFLLIHRLSEMRQENYKAESSTPPNVFAASTPSTTAKLDEPPRLA